jgi:chemotaxis protein CheC
MTLFTELEIDALQEVMNISFGNAAADLAEVIDIFIKLNVPHINVIKVPELADYINSEIKDFEICSIVEQNYHGNISGVAFLIFPYGIEIEFISYFHDTDARNFESDDLPELE